MAHSQCHTHIQSHSYIEVGGIAAVTCDSQRQFPKRDPMVLIPFHTGGGKIGVLEIGSWCVRRAMMGTHVNQQKETPIT